MNNNMSRILCCVLSLLLLVSLFPLSAFAEDASAGPSEALTSLSNAPLSLTVNYDPNALCCGKDIAFELVASGGSGQMYEYYVNGVMTEIEGNLLYDSERRGAAYSPDGNHFSYRFMASGTYQFDAYVMDKGAGMPYTTARCRVQLTINDPNYPSVSQVADRIYEACNAQNFATEYEKALFYHDWIINNAEYDNSLNFAGPGGVLCHGSGTCQSYHDALVMLLKRSGIACEGVTGNGHIWTRARLDGVWTLIDSTWDDTADPYLRHLYFGLTDELMLAAHSEHKTNPAHLCDSLERNYMIRSGEIKKMSGPIKAAILSLPGGSHTIPAGTGNTVSSAYYKILCPIAAWYLVHCDSNLKGSNIEVSYNQTDKTYSVNIPCSNHKFEAVPGKAPTCAEAGLTAGEKCLTCGMAKVPQETIPATAHTLVSIPGKAATCIESGLTEGRKCSVCSTVTVPQKTIPTTAHTLVSIPGKAATCTNAGLTEGKKCSVCGTVTVPQETIPTIAHTLVAIPGKAATCTQAGLSEGKKCSVCGTVTVPQETIPVREHTPVTDPAVKPNGWIPGLTEGSHCSVCGKILVAQREYFSKTLLVLDAEGLSGSTFWVDGVQLPAEAVSEKDGKLYIEISRTDASSLTTYTYNQSGSDPHEVYPVGMKVWMLTYNDGYTAKYIPEFDDLLKYAGSSIRITGVKGIRMITGIRQDVKNALTGGGIAGCTLLEYGTVLAWASEVGASSLVLGAPGAESNFAYKRGVADPVFSSGGGMMQYTNVLVGFNNDQCKADIVMRPYIVFRSADGRDVTVYGGVVQRSIGYIAYQNRSVFPAGSDAYQYVWDIIHHVYGSKYD